MIPEEINKYIAKLLASADTDINQMLTESERELVKNYKQALIEIKKNIAFIFEKYGNEVSYADIVAYNRLTNLEKQIAEIIKELTNENIKLTTQTLKNLFSENYYHTGYALETGLGIKLGFGLLDPKIILSIILNPFDRIKWPDRFRANAQQYVSQIKSIMAQGFIQGDGYARMAANVTDRTGIAAGKSMTIIQTEGHRSQNTGRIAGYDKTESAAKRLGIATKRIWVHQKNVKRPRFLHIQMDGIPANDTGIFRLPDGVETESPGLTGLAEHDINCHCTTKIEFDFNQLPGRILQKQDYNDWFKLRIKN